MVHRLTVPGQLIFMALLYPGGGQRAHPISTRNVDRPGRGRPPRLAGRLLRARPAETASNLIEDGIEIGFCPPICTAAGQT
jgi:hypothetical protein